MKKIDQAIQYVKDEIEYYSSPVPYQDTSYYANVDAKITMLEEVLCRLERIRNS